MRNPIPLSLYIHIPWCIKKCPYCDFNSYAVKENLPEEDYINALINDLKNDLLLTQGRKINSVFFGGGTPSLFSAKSIERILTECEALIPFEQNVEITLEANPGTYEHNLFRDYRLAGINRISLGAQSFNDQHLEKIGRTHKAFETMEAIDAIIEANFNSFNIDIMYGLPKQSIEEALADLKTALSFSPPHLSWYHLTIEPNTIFYHNKPVLPTDDNIFTIQQAGHELLSNTGLQQYEVSAYASAGHQCQHNLNYWQFGDYLGIGAGAHAKLTNSQTGVVTRMWKNRFPKSYLACEETYVSGKQTIGETELPFEFMLNALRLSDGFRLDMFKERTGLSLTCIDTVLKEAVDKDFIIINNERLYTTLFGQRFLNDVMALFLV